MKEKIIATMMSLPDDVSIAQAIYHLRLLQKVNAGLQAAESGDTIDHDKLMRELLKPNE